MRVLVVRGHGAHSAVANGATWGWVQCKCCCSQAWRRAANSVEALALSLQREVPDTAATMRLSGLELADAIGEVTLLGADLTEASISERTHYKPTHSKRRGKQPFLRWSRCSART